MSASSAGTRAVIGHPIHHEAATVLTKLGCDTSDFAARQLTSKIANGADLILAMTRVHRDAVLELAPRQLRKTFTLSEASQLASGFGADHIGQLASLRPQLTTNSVADIPDPIGQGPDVFSMVGSEIADLLVPIIDLCCRSDRT